MPQIQIKPFAIAEGANVSSQDEWENSISLREGFSKGLARSNEVNKAIRQTSSVAAAVAQFTASQTGEDILDNGDIGQLARQIEMAVNAVSASYTTRAGGEANELIASFRPALKNLKDGQTVLVRAKEKNTSKTVTLKIENKETRAIVKGNNLSLEEGDIAGTGHWLELQYDESLDKWVLQNPAKGINPASGVPIGTIEYFAASEPPGGYLKADGSAVGRATYLELFAAIGTTFGEGDGSTTFNLPDLRGEFIRGWDNGRNVDAARKLGSEQGDAIRELYGALGTNPTGSGNFSNIYGGAVQLSSTRKGFTSPVDSSTLSGSFAQVEFRASNQVPTANENRPRNLALLACIKAFDTAFNPELINITELANEMARKVDKVINGKNTAYVVDTYKDAHGNWWRKWSDGWLEQGGKLPLQQNTLYTLTFLAPFTDTSYTAIKCNGAPINEVTWLSTLVFFNYELTSVQTYLAGYTTECRWYVCGQGNQ